MKTIYVTEICDCNGLYESANSASCFNKNRINGDYVHKSLDSEPIMKSLQRAQNYNVLYKNLIDYYDRMHKDLLYDDWQVFYTQSNDALKMYYGDILISGKPDRIYKKKDKYIIIEYKTVKYYSKEDWRRGCLQVQLYKQMLSNDLKIDLENIECYVVNLTNEEKLKVDNNLMKEFHMNNIEMMIEKTVERIWKNYWTIIADYVENDWHINFEDYNGNTLGSTMGRNFRLEGQKYMNWEYKIPQNGIDKNNKQIRLVKEKTRR